MIIVTDSGSTKTDWSFVSDNGDCSLYSSAGCNPYFMSLTEMESLFCSVRQSMPRGEGICHIWFYGAGCTPGEKCAMVRQALTKAFGNECHIEVETDMLGAARALCGTKEGIACILGTGSNSCLYDGEKIIANTPPLGFILGDEGSGANLGKLFVGGVLKDQLSPTIKSEFLKQYGPVGDIIDRVYRKPFPNRWLASLSPFICQHLTDDSVRDMVARAFEDFFTRNIINYKRPDLKIGMIGSVAYHYKEIISEVASNLRLSMGTITRSPIEGLIQYHNERR